MAEAEIDVAGFAAGFLWMIERRVDFGATVILLGDEVDHARDRVRAVQRGGAFAQHLDGLDGRKGDAAQVNRIAEERIVGEPVAIEEHECTALAQVAARKRPHGLGDVQRRGVGRDRVQRLLDIHDAEVLEGRGRDNRNGLGGLRFGPRDHAAGDDHLGELLQIVVALGRWCGLCAGGGRKYRQCAGAKYRGNPMFHWLELHLI